MPGAKLELVMIPDAQTEKGVQAEEEILCITSDIRERVIDAAMREGFDLAGIASVPMPGARSCTAACRA